MATVKLVQQGQTARRKMRNPQHTFNIRHEPFQIAPFMLAPVLPGETLKNFLFQSRVVSQPVRNRLVGWWLEYYFFYVKLRDLDGRADFEEMMLNLEKDMSSYVSAASAKYNHVGGTINWGALCHKRVVEEYFRNEGEDWDDYTVGGLPLASLNIRHWMDSILPDVAVDDVDVPITVGVDDIVTASEIDQARRTWEFLRMSGKTAMDYEDYLATYGVRPERAELHRPELVRYVREWQYPSNTINPTDGAATTALSWSIAERGDKDRYFREHGFLVGYTVARPKLYLSTTSQIGNLADSMSSTIDWLPAIMADDPQTSYRHFADAATGPLGTYAADTGGYWVDLKDLFMHGDQFVDRTLYDATAANINTPMNLVGTDLRWRYPTETYIDTLFAGSSGGYVEQDGVVNLTIASTLKDTSLTTTPVVD